MNNINEQINRMKVLMGLEVINESTLLEKMSNEDIYNKYYSSIPKEDFNEIIQADPSMKKDGSIGKYTKWMLALHQKGELKLEDLYKATEYLTLYGKNYNHVSVKDINQIKTLPDLYTVVEPFEKNSHDYESNVNVNNPEDKLYEDSQWLVIHPKTKEDSCQYGKGTKWCTSADNNNQFDNYNERGKLFINVDKKNKRKYQFHFEDKQFMDEKDARITHPISKTIGMSEGLMNFYEKQYGHIANFILNTDNGNYKMVTYKSQNGKLKLTFIREDLESSIYINRDLLLNNFYLPNGNKVQESENFRIYEGKYGESSIIYDNFIYQISPSSYTIIDGIPLPEKYKTTEIKEITIKGKIRNPETKKVMINNDMYDYQGNLLEGFYNNGVIVKDGKIFYEYTNNFVSNFPLGNKTKEELESMDIEFFMTDKYNIGTQGYRGEIIITENAMWLDDVFFVHNGVIYAEGTAKPIMTYPIPYTNLEEIKDIPFYRDVDNKVMVINGVKYERSQWNLINT